MKTLLLIPLFFTLASCDKVLHLGAGFAISTAVEEVTGSKELGCASAIMAGAAKEMIDFIPDPFDLFATVAGGCVEGIHP